MVHDKEKVMSASQHYLIFSLALLGFIGVAVGAFGAHILKQRLSPDMLAIFEVGVRYQMYHVLAMGLAVWISTLSPAMNQWGISAGYLFLIGIIIFSGSLYLLALTGVKTWGAITPIGGLLFLLGWLALIIAAYKNF